MSGIAVNIDSIDWAKQGGLVPAIVQDARTLQVLMLGYMDRAALQQTLECGQVTFFSRSRQRLWRKGEESGHVLELVSVDIDCDADSLLVLATPRGPTCHLQRASCFPDAPFDGLQRLEQRIAQRDIERPEGSYTARLLGQGVRRIAQKVGEEGVETALAAVVQDDASLTSEAADLVFHLIVLLRARGLSLDAVRRELRGRDGS